MAEKSLPIFIADAFTEQPFSGNPAAICCLKKVYIFSLINGQISSSNICENVAIILTFLTVRINRYTLLWNNQDNI